MFGRILTILFIASPLFGQVTTDTLAYDTFTDTNGVLLQNHTMNIGSGWTKLDDADLRIYSNRAEVYAGDGHRELDDYYYFVVDTTGGYYYQIKFTFKSAYGNGEDFGAVLRANSSKESYLVIAEVGPDNFFRIKKRLTPSSSTVLASYSYTYSTSITYRIEAEARQDTLTGRLYDNDADTLIAELETTDSSYSGDRVGLSVTGGNFIGEYADDFVIVDMISPLATALSVRRRGLLRTIKQ